MKEIKNEIMGSNIHWISFPPDMLRKNEGIKSEISIWKSSTPMKLKTKILEMKRYEKEEYYRKYYSNINKWN